MNRKIMNKRQFRGALFDLDGVVFDTEPQYTIFWGNQFKEYYPGSHEMEKLIKGQTLVEIYDKYFPDPSVQEEITRRLDRFEDEMQFEYVRGFEDFVKNIREKGVKTAVVTSSNVMKMKNVYAKHPEFKGYFDEILTSEDFDESKPSPDCYLKAAERFGLTSDECVVLEDSFNGLKSGRAAKMFVVGFATTNFHEAIEPYSDTVVDDYVGLSYEEIMRSLGQDA